MWKVDLRSFATPPLPPGRCRSSRSLVQSFSLRACARKRPCGNCGRMSPKDETCNIVRQCDRTAAVC
eukprot:5563428-Prymnesium_polylepis.1